MATAATKATAATLAMVYLSKPLPPFTGKWFSLLPSLSLLIQLLGPGLGRGLGIALAEHQLAAAEVWESTPFARCRSK